MTDTNNHKHSYTIPCPSDFRNSVVELARRRRVNVADLARSVVLVVPPEIIAAFPDPGEPDGADRETVVIKSGAAKGRPWRRKPRLQVRMAPGLQPSMVRRALGLALVMGRGEMEVRLEAASRGGPDLPSRPLEDRRRGDAADQARLGETRDELERLRAIVSVLSFDPLTGDVKSRSDALHVLGFPPGSVPSLGALRARFRMLATVHHPDSGYGSHRRMSQLNAAMEHLRRGVG